MASIIKFWPIKKLLSYIFKQSLGNYVLNELDLDKINLNLKEEANFSFSDLELNCPKINELHLQSTNFRLIEGKINKISVRIDYSNKTQHEIKVEDVSILLFPVKPEQFNTSDIKMDAKAVQPESEDSVSP